MITFNFNEKKTTQAALRFLDKSGGQMSYMKLIKWLYLADRYALVHWERPITGDNYVSMPRGPVLSNVLNLINDGEVPGDFSYWQKYIETVEKCEIKLKGILPKPELDELNKRERQLIDEIFEEYKGFNRWEMVDLCHDMLPEWEDVVWKPIDIGEILRNEKITDNEIERIEDEVNNLKYVNKMLSPDG